MKNRPIIFDFFECPDEKDRDRYPKDLRGSAAKEFKFSPVPIVARYCQTCYYEPEWEYPDWTDEKTYKVGLCKFQVQALPPIFAEASNIILRLNEHSCRGTCLCNGKEISHNVCPVYEMNAIKVRSIMEAAGMYNQIIY